MKAVRLVCAQCRRVLELPTDVLATIWLKCRGCGYRFLAADLLGSWLRGDGDGEAGPPPLQDGSRS
jgi:hypothetical protein